MINNIYKQILKSYEGGGYKPQEDIYLIELLENLAILLELCDEDEIKEFENIQNEHLDAYKEWKSQETKSRAINSWSDDSIGKTEFIEMINRALITDIPRKNEEEDIKNAPLIQKELIRKLLVQAETLHDNVVYKEQFRKDKNEVNRKLDATEEKLRIYVKQVRELKEREFHNMKDKMSDDEIAKLVTNRDLMYGIFTYEDIFKEKIFDWIRDCMNKDSSRLVECGSHLAERCQEIAEDAAGDMDEDRIWDIARDVTDEIDWHDIAYDHDIPNKEEVREIIAEDFKEHLDDYIDTDKPLDDYIQNLSGEKIQEQVKKHLLKFFRLLTNDLSNKAITVEEETDDKA